MKSKRGIIFFIFLLICCSLFANNLQKTYQLSDDVWIRTNRLAVSTGHLGPSPVSPITGEEILQALNRLDYSSLSIAQKKEYDSIIALLNGKNAQVQFESRNIRIDPTLFLGLELYGFNNTKSTLKEEFFIPYRDRTPFFYGELEAYFGNMLYLDLQYAFRDGPQGFGESGKYFYNFSNASFLISPTIDGSWLFYSNNTYTFFNYQPIKVGGSIGNEYINLFIGRNRQEFGNGVSGNLVIGDNFSYQELVKFSAFTDIFSYYLSLTHFDNIEDNRDFQISGLHQNRLIHRFDFNFFNKFRFAINVGAHILSDSPFDFRMLNPMMIVHNWNNNSEDIIWEENNGDEINNILGFEFEYAFCNGWLATLQVVIDQMKIIGESGTDVPNALGFLGNVKNFTTFKGGFLDSYIEFAYTTPYLYLNKKTLNDEPFYMLDHIVGYRYNQHNTEEEEYTGYIYGPDAIVVTAGVGYSSFKNWDINGSILYMAHGEKGKEEWRDRDNRDNKNVSTPSGTVEHTLNLKAGFSYDILENLTFSTEAGTSFIWNYHNSKDTFKTFAQMAIGIKWIIL